MHENNQVDWKRVLIFASFAYGIAWLTGLVIYLRGGIANSREIIPNTGFTEAFILMATAYMFAPAIGHILTRLVTKEGWQNLWLKPNLKTGWPYWLAAWFGTPLLIALGTVIYFVIFPQHFDPSLSTLEEYLAQMQEVSGTANTMAPLVFVIVQTGAGILISPFVNLLPVLGEEFGWRAYLQPKLLPLGQRKAMILTGVIWGLWHAPVIAMGHNYGFDYPGAPWTGILAFTLVPVAFSVVFGWASLQAKSVWPAAIAHATLNGIAAISLFFIQGAPNPLLGPSSAGLVGSLGFTLAALVILFRLEAGKTRDTVQAEAG